MKIRAKIGFIDKDTGASILAGEFIDAGEERAAELVKAGVCEAFEPMPKNKPAKGKKSADK